MKRLALTVCYRCVVDAWRQNLNVLLVAADNWWRRAVGVSAVLVRWLEWERGATVARRRLRRLRRMGPAQWVSTLAIPGDPRTTIGDISVARTR